eukprot:1151312-Pelagomonas_calceolata.AAC.7
MNEARRLKDESDPEFQLAACVCQGARACAVTKFFWREREREHSRGQVGSELGRRCADWLVSMRV